MHKVKSKIDQSNLLFRLALMTRRWRQVLDTEVQATGLTDATWRPLLHLYLLGNNIRQKDLAASVGIEGPSIVRLMDTLVTKGLVERSEDGSDRRAKLLRLTAEGESLVARIQETVLSLEKDVLSPFSDDEISQLSHYIMRLEATVDTMRQKSKR